jgi:hypothetical protein
MKLKHIVGPHLGFHIMWSSEYLWRCQLNKFIHIHKRNNEFVSSRTVIFHVKTKIDQGDRFQIFQIFQIFRMGFDATWWKLTSFLPRYWQRSSVSLCQQLAEYLRRIWGYKSSQKDESLMICLVIKNDQDATFQKDCSTFWEMMNLNEFRIFWFCKITHENVAKDEYNNCHRICFGQHIFTGIKLLDFDVIPRDAKFNNDYFLAVVIPKL